MRARLLSVDMPCTLTHVHVNMCSNFTLKRSMYDYKLYVSLLIFVYSLMDSDERASLQKNKCFERQTVLCACCASDGCCHFTCVICACFNICCNEHVWHVHGALHVVMSKKNLEMSIEYLKRATFIIKKEVGGRELTKLWVYSLVLPSQLRFPPNVFFPNFVRGGMVQSLDRCAMMGCPSFLFCI